MPSGMLRSTPTSVAAKAICRLSTSPFSRSWWRAKSGGNMRTSRSQARPKPASARFTSMLSPGDRPHADRRARRRARGSGARASRRRRRPPRRGVRGGGHAAFSSSALRIVLAPVLLAVDLGQDRGRERREGPSNATRPAFSPITRSAKSCASATSWMLTSAGRARSTRELADQPHDLPRGLGIEARRRLVHQQQVGILHQRAPDAHALALPARERVRALVVVARKPHALEHGEGTEVGGGKAHWTTATAKPRGSSSRGTARAGAACRRRACSHPGVRRGRN